MIVADTNVISYLIIPGTGFHRSAVELFEFDKHWTAPISWQYEFLNILSLYLKKSIIDTKTCRILFGKSLEMIETVKPQNFDTTFHLIENSRLSVYDCAFIALAKEFRLPLLTEDKKILVEFPDIAFSMESYLNQNMTH